MSALFSLRNLEIVEGCAAARGNKKIGVSLYVGGTDSVNIDVLYGHNTLFELWYTAQVEEFPPWVGGGEEGV